MIYHTSHWLILLLIFCNISFTSLAQSPITFSTNGSITAQYTQFGGGDTEIPGMMYVMGAQPKLEVYNVPISAQLRYVSGDNLYSNSLSQINVGFDINQFKRNLMEDAMSRAEEMTNLGDLGDLNKLREEGVDKVKEKAIEKLKKKLASEDMMKALEDLKELENVESALQNPAFQEKLSELTGLEEKYGISSLDDIENLEGEVPPDVQKRLYKLYALKEKYEKLMARKEQLGQIRNKLERAKELQKKLEKLENPSVASVLRDPDQLKDFLIKNGGMSKVQKILMSVNHFNIGKSFPNYSPYTVNRVAMTGVDIGLTPGTFYISGLGGKTVHNIFDSEGRLTQYNRNIYGGKLGVGEKSGTHFYIMGIKCQDDPATALEQDSLVIEPRSNVLLGIDLMIKLFDGKMKIGGEAVGSAHNRSDFAPAMENLYTDNTPEFVRDLFTPNFSTHVGLAYKADLKMNLFENNTQVEADYEYIAPGFESLSAPILISDRLFYDFSLKQSLFDRRLQISVFHKQEQDNLIPWKAYQTSSNSTGVNFSYRGDKGMMVQGNYSPYFQRNDLSLDEPLDTNSISNAYHMLNLTSSWNFKVGDMMYNSQISMMLLGAEMNSSNDDIPSTNQSTTNIIFNQSVSNRSGTSFNLNGSYINNLVDLSSGEQMANNLWIVDISGAFTLLSKWNNSLGIQFANDSSIDNKFGFYYRTSVPVYKGVNLTLSAKQNQFRNLLDPTTEYTDLYVNGGLNFRF